MRLVKFGMWEIGKVSIRFGRLSFFRGRRFERRV